MGVADSDHHRNRAPHRQPRIFGPRWTWCTSRSFRSSFEFYAFEFVDWHIVIWQLGPHSGFPDPAYPCENHVPAEEQGREDYGYEGSVDHRGEFVLCLCLEVVMSADDVGWWG